MTLANRSLLRVEAQVDESDIGQIKVGNPVTLTLDALPDVALTGKVTWINGGGHDAAGAGEVHGAHRRCREPIRACCWG